MRQKILLSAALLHNPDVLILDEPMSGLDAGAILMLRELVRQLATLGKTILLSSHVMEVVEKICSRVVILNKGRVAADNSIERLRELMRLPSLEEIFARLTQEVSSETFACRIIEVMQT
jgi:ABC-2 type transport system ATP-binding protein